jgi:hypothetical protein
MTDTIATTDPKTETVIERKLREALAKRAAAKGEAPEAAAPTTEAPAEKPTKAKKTIVPAEVAEKLEAAKAAEKAAREEKKAQIAKDREERKAKKEAEKAAKAAAKTAKSANLSKVEKAKAKLPLLSDGATESYDLAVRDLNKGEIAALALHLQHYLREQATIASAGAKFAVGQLVTVINSSDPRIIGKTAEITQTHRIRVHAKVEGFKGEFYLFNADVAPLAGASEEADEEEAPVEEATEGDEAEEA